MQGERFWRISIGFLGFFFSFAFCLSGYPRELDIPEYGKFIDVLAGIEVGFAKLCFIYWKRDDLLDLIYFMNGESLKLRERGRGDQEIKRLRDSFYVQEMLVCLFTSIFGVGFLALTFVQVLIFTRPLELVIPFGLERDAVLTGPSTAYWIVYACECVLCPFVALVITSCDIMVGNLYNQLILHLELLHLDIGALNEDINVTSPMMTKRYCEFIRTYQDLLQLNQRFERCMRPFFINNVIATALATTFACVEMGIMVNVDVRECVKPFLYFLFITFPFFYWCWLGNRVNEKVNE